LKWGQKNRVGDKLGKVEAENYFEAFSFLGIEAVNHVGHFSTQFFRDMDTNVIRRLCLLMASSFLDGLELFCKISIPWRQLWGIYFSSKMRAIFIKNNQTYQNSKCDISVEASQSDWLFLIGCIV
jgi:hypothetical protein